MLLRDPNSCANRLQRLGYSTLATSGHFSRTSATSLSCIKVISDKVFLSESKQLGAGWFGVYYLRTLGHYKTCVKVFKQNNCAFCHEANILSNFIHPNLPYVFGVCRWPPCCCNQLSWFQWLFSDNSFCSVFYLIKDGKITTWSWLEKDHGSWLTFYLV